MKSSQKDYLKNRKISLIKDKLIMYQHYSNHQYHFTLVRHVDSEDIVNEKIRTNDLASEINKVSIEDHTHKKDSENDHIMGIQSGDSNNKSKPAQKQSWYFKLLPKTTRRRISKI